MSSRRHIPPAYEGRSVQAPGMMRHGPFPGLGPSAGHRSLELLPHHDLVGNKVAVQAAEMERLAGDNEKLATTQVVLRQELVATQHEVQRLKAHIRSIQTESDIQIRILLDKISKMEVDIRAGESVKKELQQAHKEAQSLVTARQELTVRIQKTTQELQKSRDDVKKIPEMRAELDSLRQEHHKLRATFEYEKGINIEQVEQMQAMEKNMVGMARELEKLRAEVLNAETRARAPIPYGGHYMNQDPSYPPPTQSSGPYMNPDPSYPAPMQSTGPGQYMNPDPSYPPPTQATNGPYIDIYGRPLPMGMVAAGEGMIPYGGGNVAAPPGGVGGVVPSSGPSGSGPVWGGAYDPSLLPQR